MLNTLSTIKMVKGDDCLICNLADQARFEAEGWADPAKPQEESPKPEQLPEEQPQEESPAAKSKKKR